MSRFFVLCGHRWRRGPGPCLGAGGGHQLKRSPMNSPTVPEVLRAVEERGGYITAPELAVLAADPAHKLDPWLVRCGRCRFLAASQDVAYIIAAVEAAGDYCRDVSRPSMSAVAVVISHQQRHQAGGPSCN